MPRVKSRCVCDESSSGKGQATTDRRVGDSVPDFTIRYSGADWDDLKRDDGNTPEMILHQKRTEIPPERANSEAASGKAHGK